MLFRRFAGRLLKSEPELQIGVMQLAREGSPPLGLCLPQTKLSRKYNQVARGRIRQFESYMPSQAVRVSLRHVWVGKMLPTPPRLSGVLQSL
jgi:hypothetical protein